MLPTSLVMVKRDGVLINSKVLDKIKMDTLLGSMKEGDEVEVTYEIKHKDGSYSQLSRLHASIRALANETGATFEEMKFEVKRKSGLVMGEKVMSFADCSKEQLGKAIQVTIEIGDLLSVNLH
jgi:hypothetical protein